MVHQIPLGGRIVAAIAAAMLFSGLFLGLNSPKAGAEPSAPVLTINPCVSQYTGQVSHTWRDCPNGTYELNIDSSDQTLCASYYTKKFVYRYSGHCKSNELPVTVGDKSDVWGCVSTWTGSVSYLYSPLAQCSGMALPFSSAPECLSSSQVADKPEWAPTC